MPVNQVLQVSVPSNQLVEEDRLPNLAKAQKQESTAFGGVLQPSPDEV